MHPGTLFANIRDVEKIGIDSLLGQGIPEGGLMHPGRAGSNDHPVNAKLPYVVLDEILPWIGAEIPVVPGYFDTAKGCKTLNQFPTIDRSGDIGSTVADVNPDLFGHFSLL